MKSIVYTKYGDPDVLKLEEIEKPTPKDLEVLIKVHATSVTNADCRMRDAKSLMSRLFLGINKPRRKVLGVELSGEIESVGKSVERFAKGDRIYGFTGFNLGAYAEYCCLPEKASIIKIPLSLNYQEAVALTDGPTTAYYFLKERTTVKAGQKVVVIGASGSIGTSAVQLAKYFGAEVTGICSAANHELVKSLGVDKVIDYNSEDFTKNNEKYDVIFDTVGKSSFSACKGSLSTGGAYLVTVGMLKEYLLTIFTSIVGGKKFIYGMSIKKNNALEFLNKLIEEGKIKPVIDRVYPLQKIPEAHNYVEQGHKKGNIVIDVIQN